MRAVAVLLAMLAVPVQAGGGSLLGSELTLSTLAQAHPDSRAVRTSFPMRARVSAAAVEFPDVASLFDPSAELPVTFARSLVDVAIDLGADYVEIGFAGAGPPSSFAPGYRNAYVFTFEAEQAIFFRAAEIDRRVTTLPLDDADVWFEGNTLFVNVEGLDYDPLSFVRIHLRPDAMVM